ncbi:MULTISPECIES: restriction endonuclease [unclassified Campylobacter]|uniref:restriction endonuclease n=1 Tax=unclassified Campylobacter TaxID=2593542 RepID=UPI0022E9BC6D|nr:MULTISPECIES: restriction endonuclease [unclassified Campylobacter]MDA3055560.1 restriction endonuclease [Campylobacter sp. CN_NA1]MDA3068426.1 restriction endonuclease [Campylobacter sp. CN_NE3]MDA3087845.1 restriction endonuclease [Campylobacter sp. CN_NA2]MDA3064750.1 restriction endonuclease [Campylobacter sp. CN_NE4]MDA3082261.1 restriction endonuclease [Campylobacter sp. CN_EL2]
MILFFLIFSLLNSLNSKEKIELDFSNLDKQVVSDESENLSEFEDEIEEFVEFSDEEKGLNLEEIYKRNKQKGDEYEFFVANLYKDDGYKIYMNGYNKGVKDEGIDIIAHKGNEALLIQCKNWKNPPKQRDLKVFIADCDLYIQKNQKYLKNKKIRKIFATSCPQMDGGVGVYLQKYNAMNAVKIEYKQILYNSKL